MVRRKSSDHVTNSACAVRVYRTAWNLRVRAAHMATVFDRFQDQTNVLAKPYRYMAPGGKK
jgi:hypothetical protein